MTELRKKRDEDVTTLTQRLSEAEEEAEGLRKEKEKLERKLKEAEEVAAQTSIAAQEVKTLHLQIVYTYRLYISIHIGYNISIHMYIHSRTTLTRII